VTGIFGNRLGKYLQQLKVCQSWFQSADQVYI